MRQRLCSSDRTNLQRRTKHKDEPLHKRQHWPRWTAETDWQTDRQTDRETGRQADRQTDKQTEREREGGERERELLNLIALVVMLVLIKRDRNCFCRKAYNYRVKMCMYVSISPRYFTYWVSYIFNGPSTTSLWSRKPHLVSRLFNRSKLGTLQRSWTVWLRHVVCACCLYLTRNYAIDFQKRVLNVWYHNEKFSSLGG